MGTKRYVAQENNAKVPLWFRARDYDNEALGFIVGVMRNKDAPLGLRRDCAESLLDRGWGKAPVLVNSKVEVEHSLALGELDAGQVLQLESLVMSLVRPKEKAPSANQGLLVEGEANSIVADDPVQGEDDDEEGD